MKSNMFDGLLDGFVMVVLGAAAIAALIFTGVGIGIGYWIWGN